MAGGGGNENYQVSFVDGDNVISTVDVDKNSYVKEPAAPTKDGHIFAGWYSDSALTKTFDFKNTKITSDTKIYAKFVSEDEKFTVSFNSNGGSSVASQTVNAGEKAVKPADPTKANFIFAGWYCDADLTEAYDFNTPVLSNITLYAKWTAESGTFTVTFNSNGGSAVPSQVVKSGEKAVKPSNPTKSGCTFSGWYSDAALTTQYNFNSAVTANITLYAKWTTSSGGGGGPVGPTYYTVTFDPNEGKFGDNSTTITIRVESGKTIANLPEVTRAGYAFLGWQTSSGDSFTSTTPVDSSRTVYAQWHKDIVTFPTDGASNTTAEVTQISTELAEDLVNNVNGDSIVFDANSNDIDSVKISKDSISELNSAMTKEGSSVNSLTFKTNDGSVTLDSTAVSSLASSSASNITIKVKDVKGTLGNINDIVGNNPVFEVLITDDSNNLLNLNGGKLTITVPYDENSIDPKNCKVFYVKDDGTIAEAYDVEINEIAKTITFITGHNSYYYAILPISDADLVKHAVNSINVWMETAGLQKLFILTIDNNKITLTIDADKVFGDQNVLQNMNPEAFNGLLTNFGSLVNALFGDTTISVAVQDVRGTMDANTIFNKNGIDVDGLKSFILDFGYGFFEIISTMGADGSNYLFKTMDVTLGDSSTFNVGIVFTGDKMSSIQSFAGTIAAHISMTTDANGNPVIELKAPDALMNSVYNKIRNLSTQENLTDDQIKLMAWTLFNCNMGVKGILSNIGELNISDIFGSENPAIGRLVSIIQSNPMIINKVLDEVTSIKYYCVDDLNMTFSNYLTATNNQDFTKDTCTGGCVGHKLIDTTKDFSMTDSKWSTFISAISGLLTEDALAVNPGNFYIGDGKYQIGIEMELGLEELGLESVPIKFTVILDIFDEGIDELVDAVVSQNSPN